MFQRIHRVACVTLACVTLASGCAQVAPVEKGGPSDATDAVAPSAGIYRLPYADSAQVKVFDDALSHRPKGRVDFFAASGERPHAIVAAAAGRIAAIQDGYAEQQSGRAASECRNNHVWIAHANGEWTGYSHFVQGTVTGKAGLHVGDQVRLGQYLGDEGAVGCAMLEHLHFEVAAPGSSVDAGGFLLDNDNSRRNRTPRFCGVDGEFVKKNQVYTAAQCTAGRKR